MVTVVSRIEVLTARLPLRFSFQHALADRSASTNLYVKLTLSDGSVGFGEGVPRPYVTGETVDGAVAALCDRYGPALLGRALPDTESVPTVWEAVAGCAPTRPGEPFDGAALCALELALLDASGRAFRRSVRDWLGPMRASMVQYDAVVPFSGRRKLALVALLIRLVGIRQVKAKVGDDLETDVRVLRLLRRVLGLGADLRVDANCAWTADEAIAAMERLRPYRISLVEQPVAARDFDGLRRVTAAIPELVAVDESLRTAGEALLLAETRACTAFNIRVSKCGGLLASLRIARIAAETGLPCIVGAQVGESGILSAAGRHLAAVIAPRYLEGSGGRLLLQEDLVAERVLPGRRGRARPFDGFGLGVRVKEPTLRAYGQVHATLEAPGLRAAEVEHAP